MTIQSKIIVIGSGGQLGNELRAITDSYPEIDFVFLLRDDLVINDSNAVMRFFEAEKPQYCINCAAYTAVDKAESDIEMAFLINGEVPGILASTCKMVNCRFIHISTDYVFNGKATHPYKENEPVDPLNIYGASKLKGEELVNELNPQSVIVRTSWVYSAFGNNFVKTMLRLMKERATINVVSDQQGCPTYAADLAKALINIITSGRWAPGIYHYSNEGIITWFDFAEAIKKLSGSTCDINPIPTSKFPTAAIRPAFSALDKSKIKSVYNILIPNWNDSLIKMYQAIIN